MLYGLISGQGTDGGGAALPANAVAMADFVNGDYLTTTATLTAADVVAAPGQISAGVGLAIDGTSTVELIGDLATLLLAGDWTITLAWSRAGTFCGPIYLQDSADDNPRFSLEDDSNYFLAYDVSGGAGTERDNEDDVAHGGANMAAITRTDAKLVSSFNGRAVKSLVASQTGFAGSVDRVLIGGNSSGSYGAMTLEKIVIYPPQADADLPGLATV